MANVHIHFIGDTQGKIHCGLLVDLSAHHHAVSVLHREAELCTPLWDLQGKIWTHSNTISAYWPTFSSQKLISVIY